MLQQSSTKRQQRTQKRCIVTIRRGRSVETNGRRINTVSMRVRCKKKTPSYLLTPPSSRYRVLQGVDRRRNREQSVRFQYFARSIDDAPIVNIRAVRSKAPIRAQRLQLFTAAAIKQTRAGQNLLVTLLRTQDLHSRCISHCFATCTFLH